MLVGTHNLWNKPFTSKLTKTNLEVRGSVNGRQAQNIQWERTLDSGIPENQFQPANLCL